MYLLYKTYSLHDLCNVKVNRKYITVWMNAMSCTEYVADRLIIFTVNTDNSVDTNYFIQVILQIEKVSFKDFS